MTNNELETHHLEYENIETEEARQPLPASQNMPTAASLRLINKKIPIRFCEFKISNTSEKMLTSDTISISSQGILFNAPHSYMVGALVRIWIEMPDYWARKSRHVGYRHTSAPTYFQMLVRVASVEETNKRQQKFQMLCQTLNLDAVDETVLNDYLGVKI